MSKFEGLGGRATTANKFSGLGGRSISPSISTKQSDPEYLRAGKALGRSASSLIDLPQNILGALQKGSAATPMLYGVTAEELSATPEEEKILSRYNVASHPVSETIQKAAGVNFSPNDLTPDERVRSKAYEMGGDLLGGGAIGKLAKVAGAQGVGNFLGADQSFKKLGATGTTMGAVTQGLEEEGVNPLAATAAGLLAPSAIGSIGGSAIRGAKALERKTLGIAPKDLDANFLEAAKRQGITAAPITAASDKVSAGWAEQFTNKFPFLGDINRKNYAKAEEQLFDRIEDILERTGPSETQEIKDAIGDAYNSSISMIQGNPKANMNSGKILRIIKDIKKDLAPSAAPSTPEEALLKDLEKIEQGFGRTYSDLIHGAKPSPIPIEELVATKRSLNNTIKWDKDEGVRNRLRAVNREISNTLDEYGKTNPEWHKLFKSADELYGRTAKRAELENFLVHKSTNPASGDRSYASLSKIIHDKKSASQMRRIVGDEGFKDIADLGTYARRMVKKNQNSPNPSGSAFTAQIAGLLGALVYAPMTTITSILGAGRATKLINDKRFMDEAIAFSKDQLRNKANPTLEKNLSKRIRDITGEKVEDLYKSMSPQIIPALQNFEEGGQ
jgi:hypothetical protein